MSRVIILGAGASRGTLDECAPVAKQFGAYLNRVERCWCNKYPYLAAAVDFLKQRIPDTSLESWSFDKVWGAIDNRVKLKHIWSLILPGAPFPPPNHKKIYMHNLDPWGFAGFELKCAVTRIYGDLLCDEIQKYIEKVFAKDTECNGALYKELKNVNPGDCIISFNYDLLAEKILERIGQKAIIANRFLDITDIDNGILLCKPHGSLNWKRQLPENSKNIIILDQALEENKIDLYPEQNIQIQPGIIAPVPFKSEFLFPESQMSVPSFFNLLIAQWKWAMQSISKADEIVIMGFGFPPEDSYMHDLFADAAARRCDQTIKVSIYEKGLYQYYKLRCKLEKIFKIASYNYNKYKVHYCYQGKIKP